MMMMMMMVRDDRTERGPFGRRPDPTSNPTYHSLFTPWSRSGARRTASCEPPRGR